MKLLLEQYHACVCDASSTDISLSEALDPVAIGARLRTDTTCTLSGDKQEAIQVYLTLCRSKEEVGMLRDDALNVVHYYEQANEVVCEKLALLATKMDPISRGCTALLHTLLARINNLLKQGNLAVQTMTSMTSDQQYCIDSSDDDYDFTSSDDDD